MRKIIGYGGKSGGGGGGGAETPDSLHSISYAKVLDLVSEGEIQGLADGMKSVYFNETPLQNADGTYNFKGATVDFRPGTQVQDPIDGFPDVSNEIGVGVELKSSSPWVKSLSNTQLTSVSIRLGINALTKADTSNGNINGYTVAYKIELSTDGSAYEVVVDTAFSGKTTSQYQRSHRIKLPKANTGWTVRVVRTTPNANSSTTADGTTILTYTELIDARMRYPMSAIVGIQIDASQFQNIPTRAYDLYGRILSVPSNYDPVSRTYSGIWNGTFKPAWTNNPAWIFYDLLTNGRYGLGNLIPSSYVDKWGLYQIAQYCDQMVPDGHGGTEPRFTCNLYLQSAAEAYKVLQDLAALFRGITYWAGGTIVASADMPQDPTYIFTAANVIDGKFHNTGSSKKTRHTVAVVSWNDPANFYKPKAEYVQDDEGLIRYGVQQLNLTAFGCTSQGQAQRAGKWALLTSRLETDVVTFSVALDALVVTPGQVVRIANPNKAGRRNGGRIRAAVGRVVTLDKAPVIAAGDSLSIILPTGISETKVVSSVSGNDVTVDGEWSVMPQAQAVWSVDSAALVAPTYRIISITQKDSLSFEISAIRHEPGKFGYIDNGTKIQAQPVTIQKSIPSTPTNLMFSSTPYWVDDSVSAVDGILSWTGSSPNYLVSYRRGDDIWTDKNVATSSIDIKAMQPGDYSFSVTAVSSTGLKSQAATYTATVTPQLPPLPAVTGLALESAFTTNSAKLKWNGVIGATSYKMSVVANGVTVRTVALGNALRYEYSTADMKADGGPWRNVSFNVQAFGKFGTQSPVASLSANNPQIGALTNIRIDAGIRTGFFKCTPPGDEDFAGIIVWISTDPTCPATDGNKVYDGQDTFVTISKLGDGVTSLDGDATYYVRAAAYDTFGKDSLTISSAIVFTAVANAPDANSITAAMIKAGALDITKFASGLQPVGVVNSLPAVAGYTGPTIVTLTTDGKLYRLVGGVWTSAIPTTDLAGQLSDSQLAAISAAKVTGQLSDSQIQQVSAAKVAGKLSDAQIDAVSAAKLVGQVVASQIQSVAAGAVQGQLSDAQIAGLSAAKLAGQITQTQVSPNAIGTPQLQAAAVQAANIAAGAITASKLAIASAGAALNRDPNFTDSALWVVLQNGGTDPGFGTGATASGSNAATCVTAVSSASTVGDSSIWLYENTLMPIDAARTYRASSSIYSADGNGRSAYLAVLFYDYAGNYIGSNGWGGVWSGYVWGGVPTAGQFSTYSGVFGAGTGRSIPVNATQCRIGVILNYGQGGASSMMAAQSVRMEEVLPGTLIQDGAITTQKISVGAVTADKVAANSISTNALQAGAVTAAQIAVGAVTAGAIAAGAVTTPSLAAGSVTAQQVAVGSLTGDRLAANTITATNLQAGSVTTAALAAGAVTAATVAAGAITTPALSVGAVTAINIAAGNVTASALATDAVVAGKIAAGAINAREIAAGAITSDKLYIGSRGTALNDDPACSDISAWTGGATVVTLADGKIGNSALRSGTGYINESSVKSFPIDPNKIYRITGCSRKSATANGVLFLGIALADAAGNNIAGNGTFWYVAAANEVGSTVWTEYSGFIGPGQPFVTPSNAKTFKMIALLNYGSTSGYFEIQDFRMQEVIPGTLIQDGAITTQKITAAAITGDKVAANAISTVHLSANSITANKLSASSVTAAAIAAGSVTAQAMSVTSLSAISANLGQVTAGDLYSTTLHGGGGYPHSSYSWPTNGGDGYHLSSAGLLLGNANNGKYFQIQADGNVFAPGMSIVNGVLTISQANVINTLQIANEAVTLPRSAASSGNTVSVSIVLSAPSNVFAIGCVTQPDTSNVLMTYQTDGGDVQTAAAETPGSGQIVTIQRLIYLPAGTTTVTYSSNGGMARNANIILIGCKK